MSPSLALNRLRLPPVWPLLAVVLLAATDLLTARGEDNSDLHRLPPVEEALPSLEPAAGELAVGPDGASAGKPAEAAADTTASTDADVVLEVQRTPHWYDWAIPSSWDLPEVWESSFELGIDGSEGNSTTLTFRSGAKVNRKVDGSDLKISLSYVKSSADYSETKHNAQFDVHHDWLFGDSPWSLFGKMILVYDEFRPFDLELTLNSGFGYRFVNTESTTLKGRFGSGATRQFDGPNNTWRPEAMLGIDIEHKISARQKLRATCEYFPQWGAFESFRIRTDAGWEVLLDESTNMSLKLGVIDRYDSQAGGSKPNALDYSLLLLWKL